MGVLMGLAGIVSLVCWIMVLIKIFKENIGLGILGIFCGIFTFVYGWVKVSQYNIKNVMMAWTIALVVLILSQALGGAMLFQQLSTNM